MSTTPAPSAAKQAQAHVQRFGTFLSGMVMPNIGALIAWGLITALFIEKGPFPLGKIGGFGQSMVGGKLVDNIGIVGPSINYLLPILIAFQGGRMMYEKNPTRGGVLGAIATMGVIAGVPGYPMFIGAMIMGPLGGWTMKKLDALWDGKIKPGFEMLVNNFSAGIWGTIIAIFGLFAVSPLVKMLMDVLTVVVRVLVRNNLLPLTSVFIEPAKVLFLNNAVNHGVLSPLGLAEAAGPAGKSILFLLEANPGPGMGILLAFMLFGKGAAKATAPGAALIHFVGGIHEIYFPYVLMKPALLLAAIAGGATGVATNMLLHTGLKGPAAPGSVIAISAMAGGDIAKVWIAIILATIVSFLVAAVILKMDKSSDGDLSKATADMEAMKGKKSSVAGNLVAAPTGEIKNIVFACDAGMGSSAMGASVLRNKIKDAGYGDVKVTNEAIANLKDVYDIVVTQETLAPRAIPKVPSATVLTVDNFMNSPRYEEVVEMIRTQRSGSAAPVAPVAAAATVGAAAAQDEAPAADILSTESIQLGARAVDKGDAITQAGQLLVARGAVDSAYVDAMHKREESVSTYMGNFLAIPHGTNDAKEHIKSSAMSFIRLDQPLDWNGNQVKFVVGIAGKNKEHLQILGKLAKIFSNNESVQALENASSADEVAAILGKVNS
ncbi:PTS mannitol transporter subunit IICBA [Luteococcus japonicus]|nr:PTS mannitol transporter subunit IICBA [Luteococcus japonicus]